MCSDLDGIGNMGMRSNSFEWSSEEKRKINEWEIRQEKVETRLKK